MKSTYFLFIPLILYAILLNTIFSFEIEQEEDEDIVYGTPQLEWTKVKKDPIDELRKRVDSLKTNMANKGHDFTHALKLLYSNHTTLDFKLSDIDFLFRNGIINENQAILIWENLLNMKTERNELLGFNKQTTSDQESNILQNIISYFYSPEMKYNLIYAYAGGIFTFMIIKFFTSKPKSNLPLIFIIMISNLLNCFQLYNSKFYFTSFISLCSFICNVYFIFLSLVILTGNTGAKLLDYSIFYSQNSKSKEHFFIKIFVCIFLIALLSYLCSVSLRYFMNYLLIFCFFGILKDIITNFFVFNSPAQLQPVGNVIPIIIGVIVLIFSHTYYHINISYSYDLNSFLLLCNSFSFYCFVSLEKFIYIQRNNFGNIYLELEKIDEKRDKDDVLEDIKKSGNVETRYRTEFLGQQNNVDIILICICVLFVILGLFMNTYFYFLIAMFLLNVIHVNSLIFLHIKTSRIVSNFLLLIFLLGISNMDSGNFSYINEIIAITDQKFLDALYLLFKLLFLIGLGIVNYLSEDYIDLFNIYNYSSYKYLVKETNLSRNSELTKKLNKIYTIKNVFIEIFEFDLDSSKECVNLVLSSIHTAGVNIDRVYIEYLLGKSADNIHLIPMVLDYLMIYFNIWVIVDTFRNNNHSFFYITYSIHKLGMLFKLTLLMFEYSKTKLQKNLLIILNMIFITRLINYSEFEEIDRAILSLYFAINLSIYLFVYDNSFIVNAFIFVFNLAIWNQNDNTLYYVGICSGFLFGKIFVHYLNVKRYKFFIFTIFAINSLIILINLKSYFIEDNSFSYFERCAKRLLSSQLGFDFKVSEFMEIRMINGIKDILRLFKNFK